MVTNLVFNEIRFIGCCSAYCKTCKSFVKGLCKGCKLGYDEGERDINKTKFKIKLGCFKKNKLENCADYQDYPTCTIIQNFYNKKPLEYKQYKQSTGIHQKEWL